MDFYTQHSQPVFCAGVQRQLRLWRHCCHHAAIAGRKDLWVADTQSETRQFCYLEKRELLMFLKVRLTLGSLHRNCLFISCFQVGVKTATSMLQLHPQVVGGRP
ncbi:MAG: hypothetical protein ERJ67_11685 [Aphanocapsa feldmannii 277cV]|uniref:Uncharacterized protein n=1 Tax=Aphanocapsa feldmannii 277cV TaxID=2507553 RepID=A0A524RKF0_9CHRO|nr:MAG: hypothetical protein ERJ67_11685 [Aphanocapsa feldmannii 277cV]